MTALPNPFLSASDGLHPLSSVAVAPLAPPALGATAEISSAEPLSAGPAVVAGLNPGSVTTAGTNTACGSQEMPVCRSDACDLRVALSGVATQERPDTNSAWVRDRIELQELLGTGMQTPYPVGPWPVDIDPLAFLRDIPDVWLDPSPEFLRSHRIEPLVIPTAWPELMRERY